MKKKIVSYVTLLNEFLLEKPEIADQLKNKHTYETAIFIPFFAKSMH
jgi:hypothetical protein